MHQKSVHSFPTKTSKFSSKLALRLLGLGGAAQASKVPTAKQSRGPAFSHVSAAEVDTNHDTLAANLFDGAAFSHVSAAPVDTNEDELVAKLLGGAAYTNEDELAAKLLGGAAYTNAAESVPGTSVKVCEHKWVQCDRCDKWREIGLGVTPPAGNWYCSDNPDILHNSCDAPQVPITTHRDIDANALRNQTRTTASSTTVQKAELEYQLQTIAGPDLTVPAITGYEQQRLKKIAENKAVMTSPGLPNPNNWKKSLKPVLPKKRRLPTMKKNGDEYETLSEEWEDDKSDDSEWEDEQSNRAEPRGAQSGRRYALNKWDEPHNSISSPQKSLTTTAASGGVSKAGSSFAEKKHTLHQGKGQRKGRGKGPPYPAKKHTARNHVKKQSILSDPSNHAAGCVCNGRLTKKVCAQLVADANNKKKELEESQALKMGPESKAAHPNPFMTTSGKGFSGKGFNNSTVTSGVNPASHGLGCVCQGRLVKSVCIQIRNRDQYK